MLDVFEKGDHDGGTVNAVYLSVMNRDSIFMGKTLEGMDDLPSGIRLVCCDSEVLDSDESAFLEMLKELRRTDILLVEFHGDQTHFRKYDRMMEVVEEEGLDMLYDSSLPELNEENRHRFRHSDRDYLLVRGFVGIGGADNHHSLMKWLCREVAGCDVEVPEVARNRTEGLYHPDLGDMMELDEYLETLDDDRITIGVMMHQTSWLKDRKGAIDTLIRKLEGMDVNTIPVFFQSSPDEITGSIGVEAVIEKYFKRDGRPLIDTLVICTGFSQVSMNNVSGEEHPHNFFLDLDVPVIQAINVSRPVEKWREDIIGLTSSELGANVIWPEFDGQTISVPVSFNSRGDDGIYRCESVPDRIHRIADLAVSWAKLRRKPVSERRVAFLFNMYPPSNDRIGGASGLDSLESVRRCLIAMKDEGYNVGDIPESGNAIVNRLLEGVTSDTEWVPDEEIPERSADLIDMETYSNWYAELTDKARAGIEQSWGEPPGDISTHMGRFLVPGYTTGKTFIGIQPNRGQHSQAERLYHDPYVVMPHQYLAYYRWLKYVFKADCIIHLGTHGTLEWLPGKGNGLSADCYPDVVLDTMPNVYPYIIDDPGEGIQCKRRANSVLIGHMCPSMMRGGSYDDLMDLEGFLQEYLNSRSTMQDDKRQSLDDSILEEIRRLDMFEELGLDPECTPDDVDSVVDDIYDYLSDIKDAMIKDGLHILGEVPEGERLREMVYSLCRLRNGSIPSLRGCVCNLMGHDLDDLLDNPSGMTSDGEVKGMVLERVDSTFNALIDRMDEVEFDHDASIDAARGLLGGLDDDTTRSINHVTDVIMPGIRRMTDEIDNLVKGLDGRFVEPGPSGSPTRGNSHLLPMGRNFYSIDPDAIPSEASWKVGSKMAEDMVSRYVEDNGTYPENVGIVVWATDTMKTYGDDVAYILALMGVRPTWGTIGGKVTGMEVIPLEELGRPRIDVMPRISGLFRDSFPNLTDFLVEALRIVGELDESDEENFYRKHLMDDIKKYISEGMGAEEARDLASIRVFGDPPGQHGNGVSVLIESSKWDSIEQIAETYATWGGHAYGGKWKGEKVPVAFKRRVGQLNVTVKNHNDREFDMLDIDDDYDSLGGMNAAVRTFGGTAPTSYMGDSSDVDRIKLRTLEEETAYVMRSRVLNPKWVEGLKQHGYKGAMELSKLTEFMLGWSATSDNIEPWMFKSVTEKFVLDEEMREWINENNPYALKEMVEDLLEVIRRGLWDAPDDIVQELTELYLDCEGNLEEINHRG